MEIFLALMTAATMWLFMWHLATMNRQRARRRMGALLWSVGRSRWPRWTIVSAALIVPYTIVLVCLSGDLWLEPMQAFNWFMLVFNVGSLTATCIPVIELHERGILYGVGFLAQQLLWPEIQYCKWTQPATQLRVRMRQLRVQLRHKANFYPIPAQQQAEVQAIIERHVQFRDLDGAAVNPQRPASEPAPAPQKPQRFQFELQTLLLFVVLLSATMSWYGVHYRRQQAETQALAKLSPFAPTVINRGTYFHVDFSRCAIKPGDADLAPLAELPRLTDLDLVGAPISDGGLALLSGLRSLKHLYLDQTAVTDNGLVHLAPLSRLRYLSLRGTKCTSTGVAKLRQALPKCEICL
jgi:hypothetical protein